MWTDKQHDRLDAFDSIVLDHPRKTQLHNDLANLMRETTRAAARYEARAKAAGHRPIKAEELYILPVIGPSGATKSKSVSSWVDQVLADPKLDVNELPVLSVTVPASIRSTRQLQAQILLGFGDHEAAAEVLAQRDYSEAQVNLDLLGKAKAKRTRIVILDECHNMIAHAGPVQTDAMCASLKSLVNDGLFSLVLVGTDRARPLVQFGENHSRQKRALDFGAAKINDPEDVAYFMNFVGRFELKMIEHKVIAKPLHLIGDVATRAIVFDMAQGVVGTIVRILRMALEQSFDDDQALGWPHIAKAFRRWNRALQNPGPDPFASENASTKTQAKLEAIENKSQAAA